MADLPHPARGGNDLRYAQGLRILHALGWTAHVVAGAARADVEQAGVGPDAVLADAVPISRPGTRPHDRARRLAAIAIGSLRSHPVDPWAQAHCAAGFDRHVLEVVRRLQPQAIVIRSLFAHLIPQLRSHTERIVVDLHDADALQAEALLRTTTGPARAGLRLRLLAARRAERMLREADELWVVSDVEADYLQTRGIETPRVLVRNTVPVAAAAPQPLERDPELLLIAGYGYPPNLAAAQRLVEEVLPAVRRTGTEARVTIVGRDLPTRLNRRWSAQPGVSIDGVVDDLSVRLRRATALVFLPSWSTGTPLKIAEALAAGLPVIANSVAVAGLGDIRHGEHFLCAESSASAAREVVHLLQDQDLQRRLTESGWRYAREVLSHDAALHAVATQSVLGSKRVSAS